MNAFLLLDVSMCSKKLAELCYVAIYPSMIMLRTEG